MADKAEQARKNRRSGKRVQKRINDNIGAKNVGLFGGQDGEHPIFSIEAKGREKFVGTEFMAQADANCPKDKIPLVIVHLKGTSYSKDIVMIRITHFKELMKI